MPNPHTPNRQNLKAPLLLQSLCKFYQLTPFQSPRISYTARSKRRSFLILTCQIPLKHYTPHSSLKYKQLRRQSYIRQNETVIDELLATTGMTKDEHVIVSFGNAKFSQTSRGFAPGGNVASFFKGLRKRENIHPIYVDEYHTSQLCSKCAYSV